MKIRSLVLTGFGINCEEEMAAAYQLQNSDVKILHLNELFLGKYSIHDFDIINFPGGFSFGDDIGSGKVLVNKIKYKKLSSGKYFIDEIDKFISKNKIILGVCNGFQVLAKMGLLPNVNGNYEQEVTLTNNDSGKFEDRWVKCKINESSKSPFLKKGQFPNDIIELPVRHGEGKLIIKNEQIKRKIINLSLNWLSYVDNNGIITNEYPFNPNGSELNCAGLINSQGNVLGMMPHPEAFLSLYNHPNWGKIKRENPNISEEGQGIKLFQNIKNHLKKTIPQGVKNVK